MKAFTLVPSGYAPGKAQIVNISQGPSGQKVNGPYELWRQKE